MSKVQRVSVFRNAIEKVEEIREKNGFQEINIKDIENPTFHDRTTVSDADIWQLANNIKQVGLINPVIVRRKGNKFERVSGFRRLEALKKLGEEKVKAIVIETDEKTALLIMLSENIQREDLNPYDEVVSLLQLISVNLDYTEEEVKSFLYRIKNYTSGNIKDLSQDEKEIKETIDNILSKTGKYNFQGFINRMRVLNLNPLLIEAMRSKKLPYSHAIELNKIKDDNLLKKLIAEVIEKSMSKDELINKIKSIRGTDVILNPFKDFSRKLRFFNNLPKNKQSLIEEKIKEIYKILEA
ncbi:MAG: ParB/RepB/Spo0J family partition protein [Candidatus Sericytochromatia bacterium]